MSYDALKFAGSQRKLFEHKAPRLSMATSPEGPNKC